MKTIDDLPNEMLVMILANVPLQQRIHARRVSHLWKDIIDDELRFTRKLTICQGSNLTNATFAANVTELDLITVTVDSDKFLCILCKNFGSLEDLNLQCELVCVFFFGCLLFSKIQNHFSFPDLRHGLNPFVIQSATPYEVDTQGHRADRQIGAAHRLA